MHIIIFNHWIQGYVWNLSKLYKRQQQMKTSNMKDTFNFDFVNNFWILFFICWKHFHNKTTSFVFLVVSNLWDQMLAFLFKQGHYRWYQWISLITQKLRGKSILNTFIMIKQPMQLSILVQRRPTQHLHIIKKTH
jgi:hypothetical protein